MNKELKKLIKGIFPICIIIIILIGTLISSSERLGASWDLCDNECAKLNLTRKEINYVGGVWQIGYEVESCDCKVPDFVRVKVKT